MRLDSILKMQYTARICMPETLRVSIAAVVVLLFAGSVQAQTAESATPAAQPASAKPSEDGIPVTDPLVHNKCGGCHKRDEKGNLSRISWERTTPEGWQQAIKRMVRLNGVQLTPDEARSIVRYLSTNHGLAPEEAKPVLYAVERRMIDESVTDESIRGACVICHSHGRAASWRRSKEDWELLIAMHIGYFPVVEFQGFRRQPPPPNAPPPPPGTDTRDPADRAVEFLTKAYPLHTPEWANWRASMRAPKLTGRWLISGTQLGKGRIIGEMAIEPGTAADEVSTRATLTYLTDGTTVARTGKAIIYTGYAWRGRSETSGSKEAAREVMIVSRDQSQMEGRWFWGGYDEFGIDVTLRRAGNDPVAFGLDRTALRSGSRAVQVRIYGDNLPVGIQPADIDLGSGVTVKRVVSATPKLITAEIDVAPDAIAGKRDVAVRRAVATGAYAIYDKIDYLKVVPEAAMARLGGTTHPKGYQQFEAVAWNRGPDNKPNTPDDVNLGPVEAQFSVEEFLAVYGDDDKNFVGTLSPTGLFTPAVEGPNPKRRFSRNNYGDVWVVATHVPKDQPDKPITARAHLVVTIPLYVRWDQPEVAQ
jgi:quinohemoprotein amine dehydrogenase